MDLWWLIYVFGVFGLNAANDTLDFDLRNGLFEFQVLREASLTLEMSKWMNESLPEEEETPTTTSPAAQSESSQV